MSLARGGAAVLAQLAQLPASLRYGTAFFVGLRLLWWVWGVVITGLLPVDHLPVRPWMVTAAAPMTGVLGWLLEPWNRWDVLWYVRIAVEGYSQADGRSAFAPLMPLLIRGLSPLLGGQPLLAAALVADLACWGSLVLLYRAAEVVGVDGRRAILALVSYPVAFFLFVPYVDGLLLVCALAAWLAARGGRWPLAGLFGALAVLTKITGLLLVIPLGWEAALAWRAARRAGARVPWASVSLLALPAVAVGWPLLRAALLGQAASTGAYGWLTLFVSPDFETGWSNAVVAWPWETLALGLSAPLRLGPNFDGVIAAVDLVLVAFGFGLLALLPRLRQPGLTLFTVAVIVANLTFVVTNTPLIDSPRRWLLAFPLFLAWANPSARWTRLWLPFAIALQLILAALFVSWLMVG